MEHLVEGDVIAVLLKAEGTSDDVKENLEF
jgi:hypothetical protein